MVETATQRSDSQPLLHRHGREIQRFGTLRLLPLALSFEARMESCQRLNKVLSDTQILYNMYKKHHWLVRGHTFYQLHLLLDKHASEQLALVDSMAERVQTLGGIAVGDPRQVAEITTVPRPPDGAEEVPAMLSRLLEAHEIVITDVREAARRDGRRRHQRPAGQRGVADQRTSGLVHRRAPGGHPRGLTGSRRLLPLTTLAARCPRHRRTARSLCSTNRDGSTSRRGVSGRGSDVESGRSARPDGPTRSGLRRDLPRRGSPGPGSFRWNAVGPGCVGAAGRCLLDVRCRGVATHRRR